MRFLCWLIVGGEILLTHFLGIKDLKKIKKAKKKTPEPKKGPVGQNNSSDKKFLKIKFEGS